MQRENNHVCATNICFDFVRKKNRRRLSVFYTSKGGGKNVWVRQPTSQLWQGIGIETVHGNHKRPTLFAINGEKKEKNLPSQARHGFYSVQHGGVPNGMFISLIIPRRNTIQAFVLP